jgi:EmrB/QacA subfamily drug resistance transporter
MEKALVRKQNDNIKLTKEKELDVEVNSIDTEDPPPLKKSQLAIILAGIFFGVFVSGVDDTILATAEEAIVKEFKAPNYITWIATSYLMSMVVFTPLYGKFCDIFGRKLVMLFSLFTFSLGSLGCGLSQNIIMLIVFRSVAGIGGGGIVSTSYVIISDLVKLEDRGTYLGLVSISFAISNMLGPILGGIIVENSSWRVVFYINLPVAGILAGIVIFIMPLPWVEGTILSKLKRIDYLGIFTLSVSIILFVLSTTWAGGDYSWSSYQVLLPFCLSFAFLGVFFYVESRVAHEPVLPPQMFNLNVIICSLINTILGISDFTIIYYLPVYFQILKGETASQSGYELAPFLVVSALVAMASGLLATKLKSFRYFIWFGCILMTIGSGLLCLISPSIPSWAIILFTCILSFGMGCSIQITAIGAQASSKPEHIAIVAGFFNFTMNFGGTIGLAIDGSIINGFFTNIKSLMDNSTDGHGPVPQIEIDTYYVAIRAIFYFLLATSILGLLSSVFLKHKSLKGIKMTASH